MIDLEAKYAGETHYWVGEFQHLKEWFVDGTRDWWGIAPPSDADKVNFSSLWTTNAVMTIAKMQPSYLEELQLDSKAFAGQRVLEVGCGPLLPGIVFEDCELHTLDPLLNTYMGLGYSIYDYPIKPLSFGAEVMPYPTAYFDSAFAVNSLDHTDDFRRTAYEMQRVVKPGGGIFFEIEYHKPTREEPHELSDELVLDAFTFTEMKKVREIGKMDLFNRISARFGTTNVMAGAFTNENRYVTWHGVRK